ncbi:SSS family solute:Na+ symporter [Kushneria sinocarnis]|uniref:SSS family solute:Na+ symporter n=1 Tax=Kushneria sinocarnis TaxID=595502 RepID=A0A420WVZ7_9GAMM|nr:sodium:solute symporter [Kushneria sinocarnis]RKR03309.1 SSS family solute:Na+ symporter [Kushneria sinocarnis]
MWLDLLVIALYALGMLCLGWWGMKRATNQEDYLVAGRRLGPGLYIGTLSAVVLGGASTVGTVKLGYTYGLSGMWLCAALGLGLIVLSLALARPLAKLKLYTVTQLLERRYTPAAKTVSSAVMLAYDLMIAVTSTIAIGTLVTVLFSVPSWVGILIGGTIVVIYSTIGGMWSLTLTDIIQFLVMTVGMVALMLPLTVHYAGGWSALMAKAEPGHFSLTGIGWNTIITYFVIYFLGILIGQDIWQRVFTARSSGVARVAGTAAGLYCIAYGVLGALVGVAASVLLPNLDDANNAFAAVAQLALPDGVRGLIIAAAMAAMMSTSSAGTLAASTLLTRDLLPAVNGGRPVERLASHRLCTLAIGVVTILLSLLVDDVIGALTIAYNLLVGGMLVPIIGAMFWKRASNAGAIGAMIAGTLAVVVFMLKDGLLANSPIYAGLIASLLVFVAGSLLRPQSHATPATASRTGGA